MRTIEGQSSIFFDIVLNLDELDMNQVAIFFKDEKIDYKTFQAEVLKFASYLKHLGVEKGDRVCFLLERTPELLYTIFALGLIGAVYVPLNTQYPASLISFILEDTSSKFIVTQKKFDKSIVSEVKIVYAEDVVSKQLDFAYEKLVNKDDLVYILYTSGTTGVPKGVMIKHSSLRNDINHIVSKQIEYSAFDRVLFSTNICFDQSVEEIYPALLLRKSLIIVRDFFDAQWAKLSPTLIVTTPTIFLNYITKLSIPNSVKSLVLGGEKLTLENLNYIFNHSNIEFIFNSYGPTECTDQCLVKLYKKGEQLSRITLGKPITETEIYLLDENLNKVDNFEVGELYVSGAGVAKGYLNRPDVDSVAFVRDPFRNDGRKMFKTGDFGRYTEDGEIEFVGRIDKQVKLNGQRIEVDGITKIVSSISGVSGSFIQVVRDNTVDRLVVYVTPETVAVEEVMHLLKSKLSAGIVPSRVFALKEFPLTLNGKLDTTKLPNIGLSSRQSGASIVNPSNDFESDVLKIFKTILKLEFDISMYDNFYELGGHSILLAQMISQVNTLFLVDISITDFMLNPTPIYLCSLIKKNDYSTTDGIKSEILANIKNFIDFPVPTDGKILVVGAGNSGIKTGIKLMEKNIDFKIIDKNPDIGGVWLNKSNKDSKLQTTSDSYNLTSDFKYKELYPNREQVLSYMHGISRLKIGNDKFEFNTELTEVKYSDNGNFLVTTSRHGEERIDEYIGIVICTGRNQTEYIPSWANNCYMTNRAVHASRIDMVDLSKKDVVIVGGGSYAVEAFRIAHLRKARSVTLVARKTYWILPTFAESILYSAIDSEKLRFKRDYFEVTKKLKKFLTRYYRVNGLDQLIPKVENSNFGPETSTSDDFFSYARNRNSQFLIDEVSSVHDDVITFKSEKKMKYDLIICATGYKPIEFNFLKKISNGFPYVYKGFVLLSDPRVTFVGLVDDFISFVKPLDLNIELALSSIFDISKRPKFADVKKWINDTPLSLILKYKSYINWLNEEKD